MAINKIGDKLIITFNDNKYNLIGPPRYGGNSMVFFFSDINNEYAVKIFNCKKNKEIKKRYKRFSEEIDIVTKKLFDLDFVIPCLDYNLPNQKDIESKNDYAYYVMPKCEGFYVKSEKKILNKLYDVLSLAESLKIIHSKNIAHRDIKPQNILFYNDKLCYSDFGIALDCDNPNRLTYPGEKVGPSIILPPELRNIDLKKEGIEYYKSDVYLLSKVLWMYLKKDDYGYFGEYIRENKTIYFNPSNNEGISTFEPLQLLFEKSTKDDIEERIDLNEFIVLLKKQIDVINNNIDENELNKLIIEENTRIYFNDNKINKAVYEDVYTIFTFMKLFDSKSFIIIKNINFGVCLKLDNYFLSLSNEEISIKTNLNNRNILIKFNVSELIYDLNRKISYLSISKKEEPVVGDLLSNKNYLFGNEFYLNEQFVIEIIPKYVPSS